MLGVPGIASRIFSSVRDAGINVIMISQVRPRTRHARTPGLGLGLCRVWLYGCVGVDSASPTTTGPMAVGHVTAGRLVHCATPRSPSSRC